MKYILDKKYNPLDRIKKWDRETQEVISGRLKKETGTNIQYEFLSGEDGKTLEIIADILIPQEKNESYIKISEAIDHQLASGKKGVRYGKNPWPREFYSKGLPEIRKYSKEFFGKPVENLNFEQLNKLVKKLMDPKAPDFLRRFIRKILADSIKIYYSHPKAWSEIGFPGPAYPEGYAYLNCGQKEKWEPEYEEMN